MKTLVRTGSISLVIFLLSPAISTAQLVLPVPEFKNTVNQVDTVNKSLSGLEKTTALLDGKFKAFGLGGKDIFLNIKNSTSTISLDQNQTNFVVKLPDAETDPSTFIELYKFEIKKDSRIVKIGKRNLMANAKQVDVYKPEIIFTKIIPGSFLITPLHPLTSGSYGFMFSSDVQSLGQSVKESTNVFAFDVK